MFRKVIKRIHKKIHKHICKHKRIHKILHNVHNIHHHLTHAWELLVISGIFVVNFISAGFTPDTGNTLITDHTIVATNLISAEHQWKPWVNDSKIISMWMMDGSVDNSFYPWYCTYGAARISPEFFPFIEDKKQQRTWWGNAKDRCANAQATGYNIWSTPMEGALIVYSKIWNSSLFGHVGKVMYHNASKGTLIVRDMNRVSKFTMTDRREDATNSSIECYIYSKKPTPILVTNDTPPVVITPSVSPTTWTLIATNTNDPQVIASIITPTTTNTNTIPVQTQNVASQQTTTIPTPAISVEQFTTKIINLDFDSVSDLAKHFITQRNIEAKLGSFVSLWEREMSAGQRDLKVWETATLTLTIKDIDTQAGFEWLLNLPFELVASNDNIDTSYSLIQLIKEGKIDIAITAKNKWETTLIINFDGEKIGKINFSILTE
jgi:surface antigen